MLLIMHYTTLYSETKVAPYSFKQNTIESTLASIYLTVVERIKHHSPLQDIKITCAKK